MLTFTRTIEYNDLSLSAALPWSEGACFFDIETTGFSSASCQIYLIGLCVRKEDEYIFTQLFAESPENEPEILQAFFDMTADFSTLISYNGTGFDIPFIQSRSGKHKLADPFSGKNFMDIFKEVSAIKHILHLPDYKQRTVEAFMGVTREDLFHGGELISVYKSYLKEPEQEALNFLLLHNFEDLKGMTALLPVYSYRKFLNSSLAVDDQDIHTYEDSSGDAHHELFWYFHSNISLPKKISCAMDHYYLTAEGNRAVLRVPVFTGELYYFHPDYHDYYYLPYEDQAIHKSVAAYVDKDAREKCHAYNCYTRKKGIFLSQPETLFEPEFHTDIKEKTGHFEITQDFFDDKDKVVRYISCILRHFLSGK